MPRYQIAVLPGDGIGPEVMEAAQRVLEAACSGAGPDLAFADHPAGAGLFLRTGEVLPEATLDACKAADAVLFAAIGLLEARHADGTEVSPAAMMALRRELGLYAAVRPIKLYPGAPTPLRRTDAGVDFVVLRENLEGLFTSFGGGFIQEDEAAGDSLIFTRRGTERIVEFAFQLAARRGGRPLDGRRTVTCVDKANVFRSFAFFRKVFHEVAGRHREVHTEAIYVDAMSMLMVQQPEAYDVLVMENLLGDILSDLGAGLVGGLGLAPSAEVGDTHGLFQPSHGSAEALAGKDAANPLAMILSGAMMLDWLGERRGDQSALAAARHVEAAVSRVIAEGRVLTPDLGGSAGTRDVSRAVIAALES